MAWAAPTHLTLDQAFEELIPLVAHNDWTQFATSALRLERHLVDEIRANYPRNVHQQKIDMLQRWRINAGVYATVDNLYESLNHYRFPESCHRPEYWDRINQSTRNYAVSSPRNAQAPPTSDAPHATQASFQDLYISDNASAPTTSPTQVSVEAIGGAQHCENISEMVLVDSPSDIINTLKNDSGNYTMTNHLRGYVLIFNNEFKGNSDWERKGSLKDVENLHNLWAKLGCKVINKPDLGGDEMVKEMRTFITSDKRRPCDYVCFFIMSHGGNDGNEEHFFGSDCQPVKIGRIFDMLDNDFATNLQGIPKLLFLQFCRGNRLDTGVVADGTRDQDLSKTFPKTSSIRQANREDETTSDSGRLPKRSDLLISYATQFDYKALRDMQQGTWFINAIANIFCMHSAKDHVADMMTMVNKAVSEKSGSIAGEECKEMSEYRSLLKKKLYLLPGCKEDENKF